MSHEFIVRETSQGVAVLTLNRPDVLNSFNSRMARELREALDACAADDTVRAVLLTGAGRGFCGGQDLADVDFPEDGSAPDLGAIVHDSYNPLIRRLRTIEKPVVCAVNGVAAGAGANLALACDIVIAAETASFVQAFVKVGLIPDSGGTFMLPRLVGLARATAMMMLGEKVTGDQAVAMGLIHQTCPPQVLFDTAFRMATQLAAMPTRALGLMKRALNASLTNDLHDQLDVEEALQREAGRSADHAEGVQAFLEKRKPCFTGG
ncbi:MAG TPA: 2-(1,2-epoxy-1,2-dihydrophenyl)acetyl-CoA isomerase PaaG [Gemmatimonadaceae bacterium]|jgi:2-(1,2-epoxy-1,2-dihydrophenyl)acetyl-CoA isomerase|nr:2-(1,2-epoxy-1,2-dihydrophenyl)acetyl-CoA isomerase PaaG [Gemmatimonadaceae bacterium]